MEKLRESYQLPEEWTDEEARAVLGLRYELSLRNCVASLANYVFLSDVDNDTLAAVLELNTPGLAVEASTVRQYNTAYASHVLGHVSAMNAEQWEYYKQIEGYSMDAQVGQGGFEEAFEQYLHGTDGTRVDVVTKDGTLVKSYYEVEPRAGQNVQVSIDLNLQTAAEDAMAITIEKLRDPEFNDEEDGRDAGGAAVVAMDVRTGKVLVCASYPTYDLSNLKENFNELLNAELDPMYNRATHGVYPTGSTFKPLVAVAALEEGVISLKEKINDTGRWYYPDVIEGTGSWYWNCWKGSGHGKISVSEAITVSCNFFFYELGYRLGIEALTDYAKAFGLGEKTGIEIGDRAGILAGPESREAMGGVWYGGDVVQSAIGQSDNLFSPIQLANYIATLVSGGEHYETHLLTTVKSYDNSEVVAVGNEAPINTVSIKDETLNAVKKGMHNLTTSTLAPYFNSCVVDAGAKTGTAQLGANLTNNGVFVCFAPYNDPEIAVSIVIEPIPKHIIICTGFIF